MRIYDIALVMMRTFAVTEFIHPAVSFMYTGVRFVFLASVVDNPVLARMEIANWLSPIEILLIGLAVLVLSKPAATFAAGFARDSDAASHF